MKKTLLFTVLTLLGMTQTVAQEYEYVPFVREGVKWVYGIFNDDSFYPPDPLFPAGVTYLNLEFKGDTIINGKTYKAMHKYHGDAINTENDTIPIYLREENKVVYGIVPDGKCYADCPIGLSVDQDFYDLKLSGEEFVLYDFNDPIAFCNVILNEKSGSSDEYQHLYTDTIAIGEHKAKRYVGNYCFSNFSIVEGIGYDGESSYPLFLWWSLSFGGEATFGLSHVVKDGQIIYKGMRYRHGAFTDIDEMLTIADATALMSYVISQGDWFDQYQFAAADVNGDGVITIADVTMLTSMVLANGTASIEDINDSLSDLYDM